MDSELEYSVDDDGDVYSIDSSEDNFNEIKELNNELRNFTKTYNCNDCDYIWTSKKKVGEPCICPSCKSRNINLRV